ncbi:MAG: hypothetical protein FJ398_26350 [Verrucomicrobia bacterium]|nr:hypothetical protein [Verrucomicrobiota bacterium]
MQSANAGSRFPWRASDQGVQPPELENSVSAIRDNTLPGGRHPVFRKAAFCLNGNLAWRNGGAEIESSRRPKKLRHHKTNPFVCCAPASMPMEKLFQAFFR